MVLLEQIAALLDFLERHTELALGHCSRTSEGRSLAKRRWVECAQILNSIAADCPTKSATEWRSFYNEYKSKLTKKIKLQKREMSATGGGPAKKITLTPLQERLYTILGRDIGEPLAGVRHNPLSPIVSLPVLEPEPVLEINASASTTYNSISILDTACDIQYVPNIEIENNDSPVSRLEQETIFNNNNQPDPPVSMHDCQSPEGDGIIRRRSDPQPAINQPPRRRRRREEERDQAALEASQARLEQIEAKNAEATLAQARATENLAAAIDRLGTATNQAANRLAVALEKVGDIIGKVASLQKGSVS